MNCKLFCRAVVVFCAALAFASCASIRAKKPFTVNLDSPRYPAGSAETQFDRTIGGLKKNDIVVYYYPDEDAVCLEFRVELVIYYSQFWSREGREMFIAALEQYRQDYEARNLVEKSRKTRQAYGKVQGYLAWSTMRLLSEPARGNSNFAFGYTFKDHSPFFTVTQRPAHYKDPFDSRKSDSPNVLMHFTRSQAEAVAALFDQEYLEGLESSGGVQTEGLRDILRNIFNVR